MLKSCLSSTDATLMASHVNWTGYITRMKDSRLPYDQNFDIVFPFKVVTKERSLELQSYMVAAMHSTQHNNNYIIVLQYMNCQAL